MDLFYTIDYILVSRNTFNLWCRKMQTELLPYSFLFIFPQKICWVGLSHAPRSSRRICCHSFNVCSPVWRRLEALLLSLTPPHLFPASNTGIVRMVETEKQLSQRCHRLHLSVQLPASEPGAAGDRLLLCRVTNKNWQWLSNLLLE